MAKPQFITTPAGEELAILPRADYERLAELAEDAADADAAIRAHERLASGDDELIPWEMSKRLRSGENPVRVWREHRGLKAAALAEKAGVSPSYLSQIECGQRDGTFSTMSRIADALGVELDDLKPRR